MYRFKQLTLLLGDLCMLFVGLYIAVALRYLQVPGQNIVDLIMPMTALFFLAVIILFIIGLYDIGRLKNNRSFYQKLSVAAGVWFLIAIIYFYIRPGHDLSPKTVLLLTTAFGFGCLALWRLIYNRYLSVAIWRTNIIFAGLSKETIELAEFLDKQPQRGLHIAGYVLPANQSLPPSIQQKNTSTSLTALRQKLPEPVGIVVIAPHLAADAALLAECYQALFDKISIVDLAAFYEETLKRVPPFTFSESWFITHLREQEKKMYDRFRILIDYTIAILVGLLFCITFPIIALIIKASSNGPLFFKQTRVGRLGKPFIMFKYRTMHSLTAGGSAELNGPQFAAANDARVTTFGKFLRRTRLDEIPQFFNVLKGEMALIGPRPERPEFVAELNKTMPFYALRHLVKPGLAGWAQLHKSYYGTIEENLFKLEYDLYYVKNRGLLLDIAILLKTINILVRMLGR